MHNFLPLLGGLGLIYLLTVVPLVLLVAAAVQKTAASFVASRFLGFSLCGKVFWACFAGLLLGAVASSIVRAYGGHLLALATFSLAPAPLLFLWTRKRDLAPGTLLPKEAAILSTASSFAALVFLVVLALLLRYAIAIGILGFLAAR